MRASIEKHVAELEQRYGRVTACRVVLKAPGAHHRTGGLYEVNIRLALPNGREVNVGRTPPADERHADLSFAINDAFKHARRRLQDHVRRLQGQVKQHESQPIGTVKNLDPSGEFGFLRGGRWSRDLFSPQQRARWRVQPARRGDARDVRRGDGREGTAGEHGQAARKAQTAAMSRSAAPPESKAGWEHFPHDADVGVRGWGATAAEAFEQAALALTAVVTHARSRAADRGRGAVRGARPRAAVRRMAQRRSSTRWRCGRCCSAALPCGSTAAGSKGRCGASRSMSSAMRRPASRRARPIPR